jgi:putative transposase
VKARFRGRWASASRANLALALTSSRTGSACGRICLNRQKINLSVVFAGQNVGIRQVSEKIWLVTFMDYDLGYFDDQTRRLEPPQNPLGPKLLPKSAV